MIGLFAGLAVVILYIFIASGYDPAVAGLFLDAPAALITLGGTAASAYAAFPASVAAGGFKSVILIIKKPKYNTAESAALIVRLADVSAKDGVLALEALAGYGHSRGHGRGHGRGHSRDNALGPFMRKGLTLVADDAPPETIRGAMEAELERIGAGWAGGIKVWDFIASAAPAWGMICALVALTVTLARLDDPAAAGGLMVSALAAALYGAVIAHLVAKPVAERLRTLAERELSVKALEIEGMLAIRAGEGPRAVEERLKSYI